VEVVEQLDSALTQISQAISNGQTGHIAPLPDILIQQME
jgi:hypothetical protein